MTMRSLAITFGRRAGYVAVRRSAPRGLTFLRPASTQVFVISPWPESRFATDLDVLDEVNQIVEFEEDASAYAVDAPDGENDGHMKEELDEVKHIIDETDRIEHSQEFMSAMTDISKTYAVDAPDGETDGHIKEELDAIKRIIDETARIEHSDSFQKAMLEVNKAYAVDAPDGETDGHMKEELEEVAHILNGVHKDRTSALAWISTDRNVRLEAERHPEHDW